MNIYFRIFLFLFFANLFSLSTSAVDELSIPPNASEEAIYRFGETIDKYLFGNVSPSDEKSVLVLLKNVINELDSNDKEARYMMTLLNYVVLFTEKANWRPIPRTSRISHDDEADFMKWLINQLSESKSPLKQEISNSLLEYSEVLPAQRTKIEIREFIYIRSGLLINDHGSLKIGNLAARRDLEQMHQKTQSPVYNVLIKTLDDICADYTEKKTFSTKESQKFQLFISLLFYLKSGLSSKNVQKRLDYQLKQEELEEKCNHRQTQLNRELEDERSS